MARVKLGALAQDVRGALAGTVFSRNRGGQYVRQKVSPVQPVSQWRDNSQQAFKIVSQIWAAQLLDNERAAWIAFAQTHPYINVFGDAIIVAGVAMYQGLNKRLQQLGFDTFASPPPNLDIDPPGAIDVEAAINTGPNMSLIITPLVSPTLPGQTAYLWATPPLPAGRVPIKSDFRLLNDATATERDETYDWGSTYLNRFSPLVPLVGDKIALRYAYLDTETGAISVVSDYTAILAGVPGPHIHASLWSRDSNVVTMITDTPHDLTTTNQVTILSTPPNVEIDGTGNAVTVTGPTAFTYAKTGADQVPIATDTDVQRTL